LNIGTGDGLFHDRQVIHADSGIPATTINDSGCYGEFEVNGCQVLTMQKPERANLAEARSKR
jgi:hypothetical protein